MVGAGRSQFLPQVQDGPYVGQLISLFKNPNFYVSGLIAAAIVFSIVLRPHPDNAAPARADVQGSRELLARAISRETAVGRQARLVEDSAHVALARAAAAIEAARRAENRANATRARFETLSQLSPAVCDSVVTAGKRALASADFVADSLRTANSQLVQGAAGLQSALDSTKTASAAVRVAAVDLSGKAAVLVAASRPSFRDRLRAVLPHPGFGVAAGVNALGQPQVIVGASLGWSF